MLACLRARRNRTATAALILLAMEPKRDYMCRFLRSENDEQCEAEVST